MTKAYGEGIYNAYRQDGLLHVHAHRTKPYLQTKVTIDQLPFLIFSPEYGLFFDTEGIVSPMVVPYDIERAHPGYPEQIPTIHIADKNGGHTIHIEERPSAAPPAIADPSTQQYEVYQQLGTKRYLIAKADALVLAIYTKVFGPDTYENCQRYVAAHSPVATPTVDIIPGSLKAWLDMQPGSPHRLIVIAEAIVEVDWRVEIVEVHPQGFNPMIKLLKINVQLPEGPHSNAIAARTLRYEESPAGSAYTDVSLSNGQQTWSVKVTQAQ